MLRTHLPGAARALATLLLLVLAPAATAQTTYYVDDDTPAAGDGTSWAQAFHALQDALVAAQDGDAIWVAEGTYVPGEQSGSDRTATFRLLSGVALYGGFAGTETELRTRNPQTNPTILSGDLDGDGTLAGNSYHVVTAEGLDARAVLDGFVITAGHADGEGLDGSGGGLLIDGGSPTVRNTRLLGNTALRGGAVYVRTAMPSFINVVFSGNTADEGGALYNEDSDPVLTNVTISGNTATTGGGIFNRDSDPVVTNSILWGNAAETDGNPDADLRCEREGYPCRLADVEPSVLERSDALGDSVAQNLREGDTVAGALEWIRSQPGIAEAGGDDTALVFRLVDGPPVWVLSNDALAAFSGDKREADPQRPAPLPTIPEDVVGDDPETKRALILSPFQYDFAPSDEGADVARILGNSRGYDGNVRYRANTSTEVGVSVQDFTNWDNYDVIHVATHGAYVCDEEGSDCQSVLYAGPNVFDLQTSETTGATIAKIEYDESTLIGLTDDFFTAQYPDGVDDAIVMLSACETVIGLDIISSLLGPSTVYFGWDGRVESVAAFNASIAFYERASRTGLPAQKIKQRLEADNLTVDSDGTRLVGATLDAETDLRIREVVWAQNPLTKEDLPTDFPYPVIGEPEDGEPDVIPYLVKVDGVDGEPEGYTVRVTVNGFPADPKSLSDGEAIDTGQNVWRLGGEVPVTFDAQQGQEVEINVVVDLPEGGQTEHTERATLGNPTWVFESDIEIEGGTAGFIRIFTSVKAEHTLSWSSESDTYTGEGALEYQAFDIEHSQAECTITATSTTDGTSLVLETRFPTTGTTFGAPESVAFWTPQFPEEATTFTCPNGSQSGQSTYWGSIFFGLHSGGFGGENEFDPSLGALVIEDWSPSAGDVIARKTYDRTVGTDEGTFTENTVITLRMPE